MVSIRHRACVVFLLVAVTSSVAQCLSPISPMLQEVSSPKERRVSFQMPPMMPEMMQPQPPPFGYPNQGQFFQSFPQPQFGRQAFPPGYPPFPYPGPASMNQLPFSNPKPFSYLPNAPSPYFPPPGY